jgi:hypothetical protein
MNILFNFYNNDIANWKSHVKYSIRILFLKMWMDASWFIFHKICYK